MLFVHSRDTINIHTLQNGFLIESVLLILCCPIMCLYVLSSMLLMSIKISTLKLCPFRPYLQLFVGGYMLYVRYLCLFVYSGVQHILRCVLFFLSSSCVWRCPTHIMLCFCFVFLRLVYPMLPVSRDYLFLIAPSVFSNVYLEYSL